MIHLHYGKGHAMWVGCDGKWEWRDRRDSAICFHLTDVRYLATYPLSKQSAEDNYRASPEITPSTTTRIGG